MRHDADAGVARQCAEQINGVVDRAVAQRAVLEGVDAIAEESTQRLPLRLRFLVRNAPKLPRAEDAVPWMKTRIGLSTSKLSKLTGVGVSGTGWRVASSQVYRPGPGLRRLSMRRMRTWRKPGWKLHRKMMPRSSPTLVRSVGHSAGFFTDPLILSSFNRRTRSLLATHSAMPRSETRGSASTLTASPTTLPAQQQDVLAIALPRSRFGSRLDLDLEHVVVFDRFLHGRLRFRPRASRGEIETLDHLDRRAGR